MCLPREQSTRHCITGTRVHWGATAAILVAVLMAGGTVLPAQKAEAEVSYRLVYATAGAPDVRVELSWSPPLAAPGVLVMPRAIPMGYGEQRYDTFVSEMQAFGGSDRAVEPEREEGPRWRVPAATSRVTYRVNLRQMEETVLAASDSSRVRDGYLGALGYSVFAYLDGRERQPVRLRVEGPAGWPVFSTLSPRWPVVAGSLEATALDFYALADSQIVMGPRAEIRRLALQPAPLYLAVYAEGDVDLERLGSLATTAYTRVAEYFGSVPFAHYTMHQELLKPISPQHAYGMSMEHLDSSTYYLAAATGLTAKSTADDDARVLYNFAHHVSHSWVPKRAYGTGYFPFQWELAPVLDSIWFAEGFGQYAAIMAVAAGTLDRDGYRKAMLARRFRANLESAPAFLKRLSLVELSRVASTRYSEDFRTGRLVFSRGGLMAAAIDDRIQEQTKGAKSLRDALRYLVAWTARERRAFTIDELGRLIQEGSGVDVEDVIASWLKPL